MSRTWPHRPYRARFTPAHRPVEIHDHRGGACDLPSLELWRQLLGQERRGWLVHERYRCGWQLPQGELKTLCGCPVCTDQEGRRLLRRRSRRDAASQIRSELHERIGEAGGPVSED
jgi:hypothetical protein